MKIGARRTFLIVGLIAAGLSACAGEEFRTCAEKQTCPPPVAGAAGESAGGSGANIGGGFVNGDAVTGAVAGAGGAAAPGGAGGDAGEPGKTSETLTIGNQSLPSGGLGVPYNHRFSVDGSYRLDYEWTLSGGQLPAGVSLTGDGRLRGSPTEEGRFRAEVSVVGADGAKGTALLVLNVFKKRWIAYISDELGSAKLYVLDVTSPVSKPKILSDFGADTAEAFVWSPDGARLAFKSRIGPNEVEVRVVDLSSATPGPVLSVGKHASAGMLYWSPDAKQLAYLLKVKETDAERTLQHVDWYKDIPESRELFANMPSSQMTWVTPSRLIIPIVGGLRVLDRMATGWREPKDVLQAIVPANAANWAGGLPQSSLGLGWFGKNNSENCVGRFGLVDFDTPRVQEVLGNSFPSPGVRLLLTYRESSGVFELTTAASSLAEGDHMHSFTETMNCSVVGWANHDDRLATINSANKVVLNSVADNAVKSQVFGGAYNTAGVTSFRFSNDDSLLGFAAARFAELYSARIVDGSPSDVVRRTPPLKGRVQLYNYSLAPDGSGVAYSAPQDSDLYEAYVSTTPGIWRKLNAPLQAGGGATDVHWSSDSSFVVFKFKLAAGKPDQAFVIDATDPASTPREIGSGVYAVSAPKFQPPEAIWTSYVTD